MRDTSIDPVEVRDWIIERIETKALLRWLKPGRGGPIRPGTYQITRASSTNASARRAVGRTSVPSS
jgi:hypothetical protein